VNRRFLLNAVLVSASSLFSASSLAHHSIAAFDVSAPLWIKGTVVRFDRVSPHSVIVVDEKMPDGQLRRWAVDGPNAVQLERKGLDQEFLRTGQVVELCGFALKEAAASQRPPSTPGEVMQGALLITPDGKKRVWSPYGQLDKCVSPEEQSSLVP
jgi:uncharacterized protein DUF6152